jgi:RluA family pseudouridine synthase
MRLLFSDAHILVINKPAGLPVLPDGWDKHAPYLLQLLEADFGRLFIVHRLDKITSGVMVFARTAAAHRALSLRFEKHETQKTYHALLQGDPPWNEKNARFPLRANVGHKHRTVVDHKSGKPSETRFKVLQRYGAAALVEAQPMSGRTHQIRVHAWALGHPLVGDLLYGAASTDLIARPALHAFSLAFSHPATDEWLLFKAAEPEDFVSALKRLSL